MLKRTRLLPSSVMSFVLLGALLVGGCAFPGYGGDHYRPPINDLFVSSPDGRAVAYVWTDRCVSLIPFYIDTLAEARAELIIWHDPGTAKPGVVRAEEQTSFPGGIGDYFIEALQFSPDGRHVAAWLEDRIEVVELSTERRYQITPADGQIQAARWFSNDEIVYATWDPSAPDSEAKILRHSVVGDVGPDDVYATSVVGPYSPDEVSISPNGHAAVLAVGADAVLLDIPSGRTKAFATMTGRLMVDAVWRADGSSVLCLFEDEAVLDNNMISRKGRLLAAMLVDIATWEVTDVTEQMRQVGGDRYVSAVSWTPDGEYVLVCGNARKACLVRFNPLEVVLFEDNFGEELPRDDRGFRAIRALCPGWLAVGPGQKEPMVYAVDYAARQRIPLTERPFVVSPDGRRIAEIVGKGNVRIRDLDLPDPRPLTADTGCHRAPFDGILDGQVTHEQVQAPPTSLDDCP